LLKTGRGSERKFVAWASRTRLVTALGFSLEERKKCLTSNGEGVTIAVFELKFNSMSGSRLDQLTFGATIRQFRLKKKLSQPELAEHVGIDVTYLSKIENERVPPPAQPVIRRLAEYLGCSSEELVLRGDKVPVDYAKRIREDSLVADFLRSARELTHSQRERIRQIIHETERG
jgi:transcriptional regulator with XRE-family HTH domain